MSYEEKTRQLPHSLTLEERRSLSVCGVEEVLSFDEQQVVVQTVRGELTVRGSQLRVDRLDKDKGEMRLSGQVDELYYAAERGEGGLWHRLWNG